VRARIYVKEKAIPSIEPIKNDLVAIRSLFISSLYFSLQTRNVAIRYHIIKPQNTKYPGTTISLINSKFFSKRTSPLI
jgi:hypothetical protein